MSFLASDVMDEACAYLNDNAKTLYTYAAQLPYLKIANERLEKILLSYGVSVERIKAASISVASGALTLVLPTDFLLPISLMERAQGGTDSDWVDMVEKTWEPDGITQVDTLQYWAFRNNTIYFCGAITNREVLLKYERQLAVITSQNSPEDSIIMKNYLSSKTAELCARYIGMNKTFADDLAIQEVMPSENDLTNVLTKNQQGNPVRRRRFKTQRPQIY